MQLDPEICGKRQFQSWAWWPTLSILALWMQRQGHLSEFEVSLVSIQSSRLSGLALWGLVSKPTNKQQNKILSESWCLCSFVLFYYGAILSLYPLRIFRLLLGRLAQYDFRSAGNLVVRWYAKCHVLLNLSKSSLNISKMLLLVTLCVLLWHSCLSLRTTWWSWFSSSFLHLLGIEQQALYPLSHPTASPFRGDRVSGSPG